MIYFPCTTVVCRKWHRKKVLLHRAVTMVTDMNVTMVTEVILLHCRFNRTEADFRQTSSIAIACQVFFVFNTSSINPSLTLWLNKYITSSQIEKGPVDYITGNARYALHEKNLLSRITEFSKLNVMVYLEDDSYLKDTPYTPHKSCQVGHSFA